MQGNREYVASMSAAHPGTLSRGGRALRGQRFAHRRGPGKDGGGAVALVHIAVDGHRGANLAVALHAADGNRDVVNHAEALAVIGESMVKSPSDIDGHAILPSVLRRKNRTSRCQPERANQFRREGNLELEFLPRGQRSGLQFIHVRRRVHQQNVLIGCRLGSEKVRGIGDSFFYQAPVYATVLLGGKDVLPDGEIVFVAVDELEGKHLPFIISKTLLS